jgi:uncharacterized membrane protein YedE/YeeE
VFAVSGGYASPAAFSAGFGPAIAAATGLALAAALAGLALPGRPLPGRPAPAGDSPAEPVTRPATTASTRS